MKLWQVETLELLFSNDKWETELYFYWKDGALPTVSFRWVAPEGWMHCCSYTASLQNYSCHAFLPSPTASHQVMPKKHGKSECMPSHLTIISLRNKDPSKSFNHSSWQHKGHYHTLSDFFTDYFFPFSWWCNWSYFPTTILAATVLQAWWALEELNREEAASKRAEVQSTLLPAAVSAASAGEGFHWKPDLKGNTADTKISF